MRTERRDPCRMCWEPSSGNYDPFSGGTGGPAMNDPKHWTDSLGWPGIKNSLGFGNQEANDRETDIRSGIGDEYKKLNDINSKMTDAGKDYYNNMMPVAQYYELQINGLKDRATTQSNDARQTYTNTIKPGLVNAVEQSNKELYNTDGTPKYMTYLQAQDPNNSVASSFRDFYNNQAVGEGKTGMADVGIMQNMGAQAMANQMGEMAGAPMTGSQMQMMQGQNMSQAGQAMANVQARQQNLRDQGIQQGWLQTQNAYERGENARDRQMKNISSLQSAQGADIAQQGQLRGELGGYATDLAGSQSGMAGLKNNNDVSALQRQAGLVSGEASANRAWDTADLQTANAQQAAKLGMITAVPSLFGSFVGGGAGAQAMGGLTGQGQVSTPQGTGLTGAQYPASAPANTAQWGQMWNRQPTTVDPNQGAASFGGGGQPGPQPAGGTNASQPANPASQGLLSKFTQGFFGGS